MDPKAAPKSKPAIPDEIWLLWYPPYTDDGGDFHEGHFALSMDSIPERLYLACTSEADAKLAANHQNETWDVGRDCSPVRVK